MKRKALSFTMTIIVSALVLLGTALLLMGLSQGYLSNVWDQANQSSTEKYSDIELTQKRGDCEIHMNDYCDGDVPSGVNCPGALDDSQQWACKFKVDGEWCYVYWQDAYSSIPRCG